MGAWPGRVARLSSAVLDGGPLEKPPPDFSVIGRGHEHGSPERLIAGDAVSLVTEPAASPLNTVAISPPHLEQ